MMTNKLYKLVEQAKNYADSVPASKYERRIWNNHFQSKYAELIIQECMIINDEFVGHRIGEIDLNLVYKERFGINNGKCNIRTTTLMNEVEIEKETSTITLEEWVEWNKTLDPLEKRPTSIFDVTGMKHYLAENLDNIGGYMISPVGLYNGKSLTVKTRIAENLKDIADTWFNFDGLIFPYQLIYTPSYPMYFEPDFEGEFNIKRITDENGNPTYKMSDCGWKVRYAELAND